MSDRGRSAKDTNVTFGAAGSGPTLGDNVGDAHGLGERPPALGAARYVDAAGRIKKTIDRDIVAGLLRVFDLIAVAGSGIVAETIVTGRIAAWQTLGALLAALLVERVLSLAGLYRPAKLRRDGVLQGLGLLAAVIFAALAAGVLASGVWMLGGANLTSLNWLLAWTGAAALTLAAGRIVLAGLIGVWLHRGLWAEKVVVAGKETDAWRAATELTAEGNGEVAVVGVFADNMSPRMAGLGDIHVGHINEAPAFCRDNPIDTVIMMAPEVGSQTTQGWMARLSELATRIEVLPNIASLPKGTALAARRVLLLPRPHTGWARVAKAAEDRILGSLILLAILPIMIGIGIAIRLDSRGPALFRQTRMGYDNQPFTVLKFRTMTVEAGSDGTVQTRPDDQRITRLGAFLRAKSLDELPQFWNVVTGSMSIVGPRPHPPVMLTEGQRHEEVEPLYGRRHRVKPGITGWAQISGWRGATHTREQLRQRVAHDLDYIDNWSLWWDLKIIAKTALTGFSDEAAY